MFGAPLKVKGFDKKKHGVRDRSFDGHLKKDGDKEKKENLDTINYYGMDANEQNEKDSVNSGMNERNFQNNKHKQIDIMA